MVTENELKEMCQPPGTGKAYYRPFTSRGAMQAGGIFFVGINPATPMSPKDINLDEYIKLCVDYDAFVNYYKELRVRNGKTEFSRTRIGMNAFLDVIAQNTTLTILETDVIPYPTESLKQLKKEPARVIERGKEIFFRIVNELTPRMLIVHGKKSLDHLVDLFVHKGVISDGMIDSEMSIEDMEKMFPLFEFVYENGNRGCVMACRHFMYYGSTGESFRRFRENVLSLVVQW